MAAGARYAMKVIRRPRPQRRRLMSKFAAAAAPDPMQMVRSEVEILKKMRHPNVVLLHEVSGWGFVWLEAVALV